MQNRRAFLLNGAKLAAGAMMPAFPFSEENKETRLTILHTNDVHSHIDPFPMDGSKYQGMGGVAARAALIERIREESANVLLLDAGDIFQGTPYFNIFHGEPEIKAMAAMGYDAVTMGNHDFDRGVENFAHQLASHANFPLLISNYDFNGNALASIYHPLKVFRKGNLKIGVFGIGIEMQGLVPDALNGGTIYLDPVQKANETAHYLKKKEKCDLIVCLSHLGNAYTYNKVSDAVLAKESSHIDVIIGGHTHTFMNIPEKHVNKSGNEVIVNQVGWGGVLLGRLDFVFSPLKEKYLVNARSVIIEQIPKE